MFVLKGDGVFRRLHTSEHDIIDVEGQINKGGKCGIGCTFVYEEQSISAVGTMTGRRLLNCCWTLTTDELSLCHH